MAAIAPPPRNAPCPCGSGRRYKDCHGNIAAPRTDDLLRRAQACQAAGELEEAARLSTEYLGHAPDHPLALQVLAQCEYERGRPVAGLELALRAMRALPSIELPPATTYGVVTTLNFMFTRALAGLGTAVAAANRDAYFRRLEPVAAGTVPVHRDVGVVVPVAPETSVEALASTLDALAAQERLPDEVVVVPFGAGRTGSDLGTALTGRPFPARVHYGGAVDFASALNAGFAVAGTHWLLAIEPPHALLPTHLGSLVDALIAHGAEWGFSAGTVTPFGEHPPDGIRERAVAAATLQESIAEADTVGFALVNQRFVPIGAGALLFARTLCDRVGPFRGPPEYAIWDFSMRALWWSEPWYSATPTYQHRIGADARNRDRAAHEAAQVGLFRDYYARACDDAEIPPNRFAPSIATWGLHFAKRIFQTGHLLALEPPVIEALAARVVAASGAHQEAVLTPGINFVGFAYGEFGLGESLRALARGAEVGGIPFVVKDVDQQLQARQADRSIANHVSETLRHQLSLLCLNPDMLKPVLPILGATREGGGRNVGYWYWELEHIPREWNEALSAVDEVWCATGFIAAAMRGATDRPVIKIPAPIELALGRVYGRADFRLPDAPFLFLFTFDYNSFVMRKNPEAVVRAFRSAFPPGRDDVGLVVKSINGAHRPELVAALRAAIGGDPRVVQIDGFLSRDEAYGLTSVCDAYVSLHRSEGLGLGMAEAMFLGKPVVGTGYSGNLEFMHEGNSALVDYRMVPVKPGEYLYDDPRFVWAEPDVDDAARHLRRVADDATWRQRIARAGQDDIRTRFTRERAAAGMRARLVELGILPPAGTARMPTFVSYAQNGEDALLAKVLASVERGSYIDVGANDPETHSVTRAFYDRGWSGINIEPVTALHARLQAARPRDINLAVAAGREDGTVVLAEISGTGLSTVVDEVAARHAAGGFAVARREVPMLALDTVWRRHVHGEVHFLKIDVEGAEEEVLAGLDLAVHRPWIVVVEATAPLTGVPTHGQWEHRVLAAGYRFAHFDELNRYYVADERAALAPAFASDAGPPVTRAAELVAQDASLAPEQRFDPTAVVFLEAKRVEPTLAAPSSQLCTEGQFREPDYARWCRSLKEIPALHRKQWEFVYALQVLEAAGALRPGQRGLGFGCGREPLAALMAALGCEVVATDLDVAAAAGHGWIETDQHATRLEDLNDRGICPPELFASRVSFRHADMNAIAEDLAGFDFVWSCCAFEHLGSIEHGLAFVRRAMRCLRPGGIAVHTTEFNLSSNVRTVESRDLSVFRRQDIDRLAAGLAADGHEVWPLNYHPGTGLIDRYVDLPPYRPEPHLKLRLDRFVISSIGLAIRCAA